MPDPFELEATDRTPSGYDPEVSRFKPRRWHPGPDLPGDYGAD